MIMNLVEVKEFSFAYPECSRKVLDHANLKIEEGTLNVICGRSGCGKSTLLRQLKTVLAPVGKSEGEIFYRGMPLSGIDHRTQSQEIGFVMQNPDNQIVTDKVWHELSFGLESLGYDKYPIRIRDDILKPVFRKEHRCSNITVNLFYGFQKIRSSDGVQLRRRLIQY